MGIIVRHLFTTSHKKDTQKGPWICMHGLFLNMKTIRCLFFVILVSNSIYWVICFGSNLKIKQKITEFPKIFLPFLGWFSSSSWRFHPKLIQILDRNLRLRCSSAEVSRRMPEARAPTRFPPTWWIAIRNHGGDLSFSMFWDTEIPQNSWWLADSIRL